MEVYRRYYQYAYMVMHINLGDLEGSEVFFTYFLQISSFALTDNFPFLRKDTVI